MLYKTLMILSIMAVFAGLVFSGESGGPSNPFNPNVPVFINPYNNIGYQSNIQLTNTLAYYSYPTVNSSENSGCSNVTYWLCVNENVPDGNKTYINTHETWPSGIGAGFYIGLAQQRWSEWQNFTVDMWCVWKTPVVDNPGYNNMIQISMVYYLNNPNSFYVIYAGARTQCPNGNVTNNNFVHITFYGRTPSPGCEGCVDFFPPPKNTNIVIMQINIDEYPGRPFAFNNTLSISSMKVVGFFQATDGCNSSDWFSNAVCSVFNVPIFGDIIRFFTLVFDFFGYVIGWFVWLAQNLANYVAIIVWLFAIPGMPLIIQVFIDSILSAWLIVIAVEIFKIIKPFGG